MRCWSAGIIAAGLLFGAADAQDDTAKKDLDSLQGVWQVVSMEVEGRSLPGEEIKGIKLIFKGNKGVDSRNGMTKEAIIKLDPSTKPKAIDMSPLDGPDEGKPLLGIYSIEGATLKICAAREGYGRPTEFKAGKDVVLIVFKRDKP